MGRSNIIRSMLYSLSEMGRDEEHGLTGDEWWMLYLEEYERMPGNIGAIVKDNVSKARNDGKIRRLPWDAKFWHIGRAKEISYTTTLEGSAYTALAYHLCAARRKQGNILEEMRSDLNIKPVDYFNFTGYPTVVR